MVCLPELLCCLLGAPNRPLVVVWKLGDITNGGDLVVSASSGLVIKKSLCGDKAQLPPSGLAVK
jgi:hypothetical protein